MVAMVGDGADKIAGLLIGVSSVCVPPLLVFVGVILTGSGWLHMK